MEKAYFENIRYHILGQINEAKKEIKVAVCWFTNHQLFDTLCEKVNSGVKVELIILNDYINNRNDGLDFQHFINIGGLFYFGDNDKPMHNKYCIIDSEVLINGSYNWTYFAERNNEENVIIHFKKKELIKDFSNDFERIRTGLLRIENVAKNALIEIADTNLLGINNYLAQDYLYQAVETKNPVLVEKSFKLSPGNIQIQKKAVEFQLKTQRKTTTSIGEDVINDGFVILVPSDTSIPANGLQNFTTTSDNQESTNVTIRYGVGKNASSNKLVGTFEISGIPLMKAGEPKLITKWKIDLNGILTVTELIKETNNSVTMSYDINHLLVQV